MKGSASAPSSAPMNGTRCAIKSGDEGDVAGEPVELGDDDRAFCRAGHFEGGGELWASIQGIGALAAFYLDELAQQGDAFRFSEAGDGGALCIDAEAGASLPDEWRRAFLEFWSATKALGQR